MSLVETPDVPGERPAVTATSQLYMRHFNDADSIAVEPWHADALSAPGIGARGQRFRFHASTERKG